MKRVFIPALLIVVLLGCTQCVTVPEGQPNYLRVLFGADAVYDASMSACATAYAGKLIGEAGKARCIELGGYYVAARAQAVKAIELYNSTKDASAMEQVSYWLSYSLGIAAQIVAEYDEVKVGA